MPFDHDAGFDDQQGPRRPEHTSVGAHRARSSASNTERSSWGRSPIAARTSSANERYAARNVRATGRAACSRMCFSETCKDRPPSHAPALICPTIASSRLRTKSSGVATLRFHDSGCHRYDIFRVFVVNEITGRKTSWPVTTVVLDRVPLVVPDQCFDSASEHWSSTTNATHRSPTAARGLHRSARSGLFSPTSLRCFALFARLGSVAIVVANRDAIAGHELIDRGP